MSQKPLLSICIPTYNRANFLEICLNSFCSQLEPYKKGIEIIVSDNCSTDNTEDVVNSFVNLHYPIKYIKSNENLGPDGNMLQLLRKLAGQYFWIFGDDDVLLPNKLSKIVELLKQHNFNMIYLSNYWFKENYLHEKPKEQLFSVIEYSLPDEFAKKINIWVTFISAGIFNSKILPKINLTEFQNTNLYQLNWVLQSIYQDGKSCYIEGNIIACKAANTGGYELFKTFGINLNNILLTLEQRVSIPKKCKRIITHYFIKDFMPIYYIDFKRGRMSSFSKTANPFKLLRPIYKSYYIYWLVLFPIEVLPVSIGKKYYYGLKKIKLI